MTDFPEEGLQTTLSTDAGVLALMPAARVYPTRLPAGVTLPAITYQRIGGTRDITHSGPSGIAAPRFQVTCWADGDPVRTPQGYGVCARLAQAVRIALNGKKHLWDQLDGTVMLANEFDRFEPESQTYMRVLDFDIWHQEDQGP